jgi:uncharacterized protein YcbK (DUF882 family)
MTSYFRQAEFACKCGCGFDAIDPLFVAGLEFARGVAQMPFHVTSGLRCVTHNRATGGKPDSAHLAGLAADIRCLTGKDRWVIVRALMAAGFTRIGVAEGFVHVDADPRKPQRVIWRY